MVSKTNTKINGKTTQESYIFISKNTTMSVNANNAMSCTISIEFDPMIRMRDPINPNNGWSFLWMTNTLKVFNNMNSEMEEGDMVPLLLLPRRDTLEMIMLVA